MNPVLLPLIAAQGALVKRRMVRLPAAGGSTNAQTSNGTTSTLRLVVVGESTAAGCGAATHDEAFAGHLARYLAGTMSATVRWEAHGMNGATMQRIRQDLVPRVSGRVDVVVLLAGWNDVLHDTAATAWEDDLTAVLSALGRRAGQVYMTGVPAFDSFPALLRLLGRFSEDAATGSTSSPARSALRRPMSAGCTHRGH